MKRRDALKNAGLILGYSLSAGSAAAIMNGCKAPTAADWIPTTLDTKIVDVIAELAETILPATDTPGAKDVLVHRFIDEVLSNAYGPNQKAHMLEGINSFDVTCQEKMGSSFMDLDDDKRLEFALMMEDIAEQANKERAAVRAAKAETENTDKEPPRAGPMTQEEPTEFGHYYKELKGLIVAGYFTSEQVGTDVLAYDPVPQEYNPCMPVGEDVRAWSL